MAWVTDPGSWIATVYDALSLVKNVVLILLTLMSNLAGNLQMCGTLVSTKFQAKNLSEAKSTSNSCNVAGC